MSMYSKESREKMGEKDAKKRFKAYGQEPSFLIVCDKLLTGFDAPIEHVMYLDKPLKEHNLLGIWRINRPPFLHPSIF